MTHLPTIADYMATELTTFLPDTEINRAVSTLMEAKLSSAPVVDNAGKLVGILSKKDCLKAALNAAFFQEWGGAVSDYMSAEVEVLNPDLDLVTAAETFLESRYRTFPVTRDGQLVGLISRIDILRGLKDQWA
jgi:CBS domain-containing protein